MKELLNHEMELKFFFCQFFKLTERASKCDILFWFVLFASSKAKLLHLAPVSPNRQLQKRWLDQSDLTFADSSTVIFMF